MGEKEKGARKGERQGQEREREREREPGGSNLGAQFSLNEKEQGERGSLAEEGQVEEERNRRQEGDGGKVRIGENGKFSSHVVGWNGRLENHRTYPIFDSARWRLCEICFKILLQFRGRTVKCLNELRALLLTVQR